MSIDGLCALSLISTGLHCQPDQPDRDRDLVLNKSWIHQEMKQSVGTYTRLPEAVGLGWVGQS